MELLQYFSRDRHHLDSRALVLIAGMAERGMNVGIAHGRGELIITFGCRDPAVIDAMREKIGDGREWGLRRPDAHEQEWFPSRLKLPEIPQ